MTTSQLLRASRVAIAVWALLAAATVTSWVLGVDTGGGTGTRAAAIVVIVIAFVKVRFVGRHFMELRTAPPVMRLILDIYVCAVGAALIVIYLATS